MGFGQQPGLRRVATVCCALAILLPITLASAKERLTREQRLDLIRGLMKEIAVSKIELPRSKQGVSIDSQGKLDQAKAKEQLRAHGIAIRPGMPAEITRLTFKSDRVVFELNGGGRKGKKWYQRIQVGMGGPSRTIATEAPVLTYGSSVALELPERNSEITVARVKHLLSAALDFERHSPTVLYSPAVSPQIKEAIRNHQVIVGMDRDAVLSSKGPPDHKLREVHEGLEQEDWIYGRPPHVLFVTFEGDTVVAVRQH